MLSMKCLRPFIAARICRGDAATSAVPMRVACLCTESSLSEEELFPEDILSHERITESVKKKLDDLQPGENQKYTNVFDLIMETDLLLDACRKIKAGDGGDPLQVEMSRTELNCVREIQQGIKSGTIDFSCFEVPEAALKRRK